MNPFEIAIYNFLEQERKRIFDKFSLMHDQAQADALVALKKLDFCIEYLNRPASGE